MKIYILISWRNIWRNKRRSLVVISSVTLGIYALVFSMAFLNGMNTQAVENTISTSLGHISVQKKGFQESIKLEYNFTPDPRIYAAIKKSGNLSGYAPHIKIQGMVRSSEASRGVLVVGIDPEKEKKISKIYHYTLTNDGGSFLEDEREDAILISKSMGKKLDLRIGDKLVLMLQDKGNKIIGAGLKVKGFYESPISTFDNMFVFTGLKKLQEITSMGNSISEITLLLKNKNLVDEEKKRLIAELGDSGMDILTWKNMAPNLVNLIKLFDTIMYIFFAIIFITVVFSVANTLIMAIMERFHEIGVMKSIGTRPSKIFFMVVFEAMNLGFVGLAAGIGLGVATVAFFSIKGINMAFFIESMRFWGSGSVIYPAIKTMDIAMAGAIVTLTVVLAAIYPAIKAARIKPLEALHYI